MISVPQDLSDTRSVLEYLQKLCTQMNDIEMRNICTELLSEYENSFIEPDESNQQNLPYNRKDAYSILEYLKLQAESLSEGRWTDFSDSDIGTVFLKLISYLADMNNFQTDKVASELYLDTVLERSSGISLAKLVGYEPRHYQAAKAQIRLGTLTNKEIPDGTLIPAYTLFTDSTSSIYYCNLTDQYYYNQSSTFDIYQGSHISKVYTISDINSNGRIILSDYQVATNTITLSINGVSYKLVDDVRTNTGELSFSVHIHEDKYVYIQLPTFWPDVITQGTSIKVDYLITDGEYGRVGKNIIEKILNNSSKYWQSMAILSCSASEGGYNPESVDEMRNTIPIWARTMDTIVTINDFEEVPQHLPGICDISALDYNDPSSGLIQPDDYYKVHIYTLPNATNYDALDSDSLKYRNTIIKKREDWTYEDMGNTAENRDTFAKSSITGNTITLRDAAAIYGTNRDYSQADVYKCLEIINDKEYTPTEEELNKYDLDGDGKITSLDAQKITDILINGNYLDNAVDNIILGIDMKTGNEDDNYIVPLVDNVSSITDTLCCSMEVQGNDVIITLNSNWRDFVKDNEVIDVFYKAEQILTDVGQNLREYIDERRLASLKVSYHELDIVQPTLKIDVYMDKNDLRFKTVASEIKAFILDRFSRKYMKIGEPLFGSVIGSEILSKFNYIRYCEVRDPEEKIEVSPKGFIDIIPNVQVLDKDGLPTLQDKIIVNVYDYQNRVI